MNADLSEEQVEQIRATLQTEGKLPAVKLYREWTGSSLLDAKLYLDRLEGRPASALEPPGESLGDDLMDQILDAIQQGRKIEAVKLYREQSGASLKDSKEFIERLTEELRLESPHAAATSSGCGAVILLAIVIGLGVAAAT